MINALLATMSSAGRNVNDLCDGVASGVLHGELTVIRGHLPIREAAGGCDKQQSKNIKSQAGAHDLRARKTPNETQDQRPLASARVAAD
jgi:hypothetical protein